MWFKRAGLAVGAALILAGAASGAWADPEILVKCESAKPVGQRFTNTGGWQAYEATERAVTISRDKGKLTVEVVGEVPFVSHLVFALPQIHPERFRVMGHDGVEHFYLVTGANTGKTELKHSVYGGKDGTHNFNIRVTTLDTCSVVSPEVVVSSEIAGAALKK